MAKKNPYAFDRNYYQNLARASFEGNAVRKLDAEYDGEEYYDDTDYAEDEYTDYAEEALEEEYISEGSGNFDNEAYSDNESDNEVVKSPRLFYNVHVNLFAVIVFASVICALVYCSFRMIEVQSDISQTESELKKATNELNGICAINDSLRSSLDIDADRNYIYSVAVGKLGMQYPDKNQIIEYEPVDVGYVRQISLIR